MQDRLSKFLKHVGFLIILLRSYVSQKTDISPLSMPTLKSSETMKISYLDEDKAKPLCRIFK